MVAQVGSTLADIEVDMIVGGPPCQPFSRAARSLIRNLIASGRRDEFDARRELWKSFLEIVETAHPRIVIMENVPELALGGNAEILRTIVARLEGAGYGVATRIVSTSEHGVPQFRQRAIIVGLANETRYEWPTPVTRAPTLRDAIKDLPQIEPGWNRLDLDEADVYRCPDQPAPLTQWLRAGLEGAEAGLVRDHVTRAVREDDREIFRSMDPKTKYSDIDASLKRYRDDIFDDKYKRLDWDKPSRSITAHLAKDGYWYIHPEQDRTLSIREAARVQTFPDRVRFAGPPSASLRQIGNAVPPLAARDLVEAAKRSLRINDHAVLSDDVSSALTTHYRQAALDRTLVPPWLSSGTSAWQVIQCELLLPRSDDPLAPAIQLAVSRLATPEATLEEADRLSSLFTRTRLEGRLRRVLAAATWFVDEGGSTDFTDPASVARNPHVTRPVADLAALVSFGDDPVLVTPGTLRVAARFSGRPVDLVNKNSDGRLEIARLVGGLIEDPEIARRALLALMDLANSCCTRDQPSCRSCPLQVWCVAGRSDNEISLRGIEQSRVGGGVENAAQPVELVAAE